MSLIRRSWCSGLDEAIGLVAEAAFDAAGRIADGVGDLANLVGERDVDEFRTRADDRFKGEGLVGEGIGEANDGRAENAVQRVLAAGKARIDMGEAFGQLAVERTGAAIEGIGEFADAFIEDARNLADGGLELSSKKPTRRSRSMIASSALDFSDWRKLAPARRARRSWWRAHRRARW